ncbi:F-box/FBD/LRR-repeat protein-like protein [Tanacetum coccineum]
MVKVPSNCQQLKKYKLGSAILNVLLLHAGSIPKIKIELGELDVDSEFDQIICYLSRNNHLQKLCLMGSHRHCYKLPYSFFSLQGLEVILLFKCLFRPPIKFDGFSKLSTARFSNVDITSKALQLFLTNCPLLRDLALVGGCGDFARGNKLTFVELLQCVPLIEILDIGEVFYDEEDEVSSALCLIRSSPNLAEICLTGCDKSDTAQISKKIPNMQDFSSFALDHLEFFLMENFANRYCEVDFLKLIMAKSPMLKKARIGLCESVSLEKENELLRDLLQLRFPRASPSAKLIVKRP